MIYLCSSSLVIVYFLKRDWLWIDKKKNRLTSKHFNKLQFLQSIDDTVYDTFLRITYIFFIIKFNIPMHWIKLYFNLVFADFLIKKKKKKFKIYKNGRLPVIVRWLFFFPIVYPVKIFGVKTSKKKISTLSTTNISMVNNFRPFLLIIEKKKSYKNIIKKVKKRVTLLIN